MPLSRRQFLQLTGIAFLSAAVDLPPLPVQANICGRALLAAPVYRAPDHSASIARIWPDTVLPIAAQTGNWYRIPGGFIKKTHVQPILQEDIQYPSESALHLPFWAEVCAPAAAIREWCAADAPLISRIGHGGVMQVIDQLPGDLLWYGIANEQGKLLGWTPSTGWRPAGMTVTPAPLQISIDQHNQQLRVDSGGLTILHAAISTGQSLNRGKYPLMRSEAGRRHGDYYGAPWSLRFGELPGMTGVYWHNQFGTPHPGPAVQIPVYLARWLYHASAEGSQATVF